MKKLFSIKVFGVVIAVAYLSVSLITAQFDLMTKRQQLENLKQQQVRMQLENQDYQRMLESEDEQAYAERIARQRLGYANPDEKVFIDIQSEK